jgi:hypothetical protein
VGTISNNIGDLYNLLDVNLNANFFASTIPASMGNLSNLNALDLSYNLGIHGTFPNWLTNIKNLTSVILNSMDLSGTLPNDWSGLTKLKFLAIGWNSLVGTLPEDMGSLHSLEALIVDNNLFSKSIPPSFSKLHRMVAFYLEANGFTGELAPGVSGMYALTLSQVNDNFFHGNVSFLNNLNHTSILNYGSNSFSGPLPCNPHWKEFYLYEFNYEYFNEPVSSCFGNFSRLHNFLVNNNYIPGSFPDPFLSNNHVMEYFIANNNCFTGTIPSSLPELKGLVQLFMEYNFFSGPLPENIGDLERLVILTLNNNRFSGTLPLSFPNLKVLQEVFLQQNQLQGGLNNLFDASQQISIKNIDLTNNQFTGTISSEIYQSRSLQSLSLSNNCLRGSISEEICNVKSLISLSLDGLSTSVNCQVFPFGELSFIFKSFESKHFLTGTIPFCLLELPAVQLVHVSGNGLTGTIPPNLNITGSLNDISISHNLISGTIPVNFQTKTDWTNFDFSYNRLSGTLNSNFTFVNGLLTLDINRLSGRVPSSFIALENITVLNGNIFQCDILDPENTLPVNDGEYENYSCGSDNVNFVLYGWIAAVFLFPLLLLLGVRCLKRTLVLSAWFKQLKEWREEFHRFSPVELPVRSSSLFFRAGGSNSISLKRLTSIYSTNTGNNHFREAPHIARLAVFFQEIRALFFYWTLFAIILLLPTYSSLKLFYASYFYEYAWTISGMLLRGETAGIILFLLFTALLTWLIAFMKRMVSRIREITLSNEAESIPSHSKGAELYSCSSCQNYFVYFLIFLVNSAIMGVVDFSYIYIVVNYSSTVISLAVVGLAVFRIFTNNLLLMRAIPYVTYITKKLSVCHNKKEDELKTRDTSALHSEETDENLCNYSYSAQDISFLENIVLLNNIIIPILAVIFVLPDCFYYLLFEPPNVSSSYTYITCKEYFVSAKLDHICYPESDTIVYTPAFLYTYQCSSKIFINYVPVYILMFILIGIIIPCAKVFMKLLYDRLLHPESNAEEPDWDSSRSGASTSMKQTPTGCCSRGLLSVVVLFLPGPLKALKSQPTEQQPLLFNKLRLTVQINSYLATAITFGSLFPPLALIAGISVIVLITFEELSLGKLLFDARKAGYGWYEERIEKECAGIEESFTLTLWSTMIVSSCLFAYIIFDAVGDTEGWVNALPLTVVMVSVPFLLLIGWIIYDYYRTPKQTPKNKKRHEDNQEDSIKTVENPSLGSSSQRPSASKRDSEVQMYSRDSFLNRNDKNNNSNRKEGITAEQKENVTMIPVIVENPMNSNINQSRKNWFDEEE